MTDQDLRLPDGSTPDVDQHGRRIVLAAGDRIQLVVDRENQLLKAFGAQDLIEPAEDGTITLDSDGEYRYRLVRHDRWRRHVAVYERVR